MLWMIKWYYGPAKFIQTTIERNEFFTFLLTSSQLASSFIRYFLFTFKVEHYFNNEHQLLLYAKDDFKIIFHTRFRSQGIIWWGKTSRISLRLIYVKWLSRPNAGKCSMFMNFIFISYSVCTGVVIGADGVHENWTQIVHKSKKAFVILLIWT